jgi:hypothetical protein
MAAAEPRAHASRRAARVGVLRVIAASKAVGPMAHSLLVAALGAATAVPRSGRMAGSGGEHLVRRKAFQGFAIRPELQGCGSQRSQWLSSALPWFQLITRALRPRSCNVPEGAGSRGAIGSSVLRVVAQNPPVGDCDEPHRQHQEDPGLDPLERPEPVRGLKCDGILEAVRGQATHN